MIRSDWRAVYEGMKGAASKQQESAARHPAAPVMVNEGPWRWKSGLSAATDKNGRGLH